MKRTPVAFGILAALLLILVLVFVLPGKMIGPGHVMAAHEALAEDCFVCHAPFRGTPADRCTGCHRIAEIGLLTTQGVSIAGENKNVAFHQALQEAECTACHSDHRGVQAFRPISRFAHDLLEAGLQGRCSSCHTGPQDALHGGLTAECGSCHGNQGWLPATFDHDRHFRFDRHHTTECATCHQAGDFSRYTCYGCHEHSRAGIRAEHLEEGIGNYEDCVRCHRSGDEDEAERRWRGSGRENRSEEREGHEEDDE